MSTQFPRLFPSQTAVEGVWYETCDANGVRSGDIVIGTASGGSSPVTSQAEAAASVAPTSLSGSGAIALTAALHSGKSFHAEPGQTSLTIASASWPDDGELTIINHTGGNLPVTIGAGITGYNNRASGNTVVGAGTLLTLAYLERAFIQMKGAGAFCNAAVVSSNSFERGWATGVSYRAGEIIRATAASGSIAIGDRLSCNSDHVAAASFATDVAKWTELPEDPDGVLLAGHLARSVVCRAPNSDGVLADMQAVNNSGAVLREASGTLGFGTIATAGVADNAITNAKLADMVANTVKVNATAGTADPTDLAVGTNTVLGRVAGNIVAAQVVTGQIADANVTHAKLQNMGALSVMGRSANTTGVVADIVATAASGHVLRESGSTLAFGFAPCPMAQSVRVVATTAVNLNSDVNNGDVIDGVTLVTGDRVLLTAQATASANGIYIASSSGAASRATDFDGTPAGEVVSGMTLTVSEGTANADSQWMLTTNGAITVGTTGMAFSKISSPKAADAAPANIASAAVIGTSLDFAREDHVHALAADTVTNAMLANMPANTVMANATAASADPANLAIGTNTVLGRVAGDIVSAQLVTGQVADAAITYAKIQDVTATDRLLGRATAGAGDVEEITCTAFARSILDDVDAAAARVTLGAAASASPALTGDMTLTDTVAGLGPVLKLENDSYAGSDKARLTFEHGSTQNAQAFIQSNLPGSNDVDLEFFTTDNSVLNTSPALRLTGNNTAELSGSVKVSKDGASIVVDSSGSARLGMVKPASGVPEFAFISGNPVRFRRVTTGTIEVPTASTVELEIGATGGVFSAGLLLNNGADGGTVGATITATGAVPNWGVVVPVDAAAGHVVVTLPASVAADAGKFLRIIRRDTSANTVQVQVNGAETFTGTGHTGAQTLTLNAGGSVTFRCTGTQPEIKDWSSPGPVSRLWLPSDASAQPVVWYSFRDLSRMTLNTLGVSAMTNRGSLGATHNLAQGTAGAQPQVDSATNPRYATFDGGDSLLTASADSIINGTIASIGVSYTQAAQASTSVFGQSPATSGGQITLHPKWSDGNTYFDMPITSARISGNAGTAFAGDANDYVAVGIRNGANLSLHSRGNTTSSISSAAVSGSSTGSGILRIGDAPSGGGGHNGRIYEFVSYRIALTNDERDRLAAYLLWGTGGQAQIHTSNPYRNARPLVTL